MRRASVGARLARDELQVVAGIRLVDAGRAERGAGVAAHRRRELGLAEPFRRRRDVVEAELPRLVGPRRLVGREGQQRAQEGRRRHHDELLARRQRGDVVLDDVGARRPRRRAGRRRPARRGAACASGSRRSASAASAWPSSAATSSMRARVSRERRGGRRRPAPRVARRGRAPSAGGRRRRRSRRRTPARRPERARHAGRRRSAPERPWPRARLVERALAAGAGGELAHRGPEELDEALAELDPAGDGRRRQARLEIGAGLLEQARRGAQAAGDGVHALVRRPELAHEQREQALSDIEVPRGLPVLDAAQLEVAQEPARDLHPGEGVDRRVRVVGADEAAEARFVAAQHAHARREGGRRPGREPVRAGGQAERRRQHGVVGDEIVEERLDERLGPVHAIREADAADTR